MILMISPILSVGSVGYAQELSKNDQLFKEDIQYRLGIKTQTQIYRALNNYKAKIINMEKASANQLTDSIIQKIDQKLYIMRTAESNNKELGKQASPLYMAYMLIKFELMLLK